MSKNPFVNCKSRKKRKTRIPISEPKPKLFCPRTMVRYDGTVSEFSTIWVCKMCLISLLSEQAVQEHLVKCNAVSNKAKPPPTKNNEDTSYICTFCNKEFSRRVTLKKHIESHKNSSTSSLDSEQSVNEDETDPLITVNANKIDDKPEEENPCNSTNLM